MADNKNQHFVPRCHLRPFTVDGENRAINLFNLARRRPIANAPVKNQCSSDYFYGHDPLLEDAINFVENGYAYAVRRLLSGVLGLARVEIVLKRFIFLQHLRTEEASRNAASMTMAFHDVPGSDLPRPSLKEAMFDGMQAAMRAYADTMGIVDDLALCLVRNRSRTPFITSDNPAVITNRWHLGDARTEGRSFGAKSAGAVFALPLSPDLLALLYDADVYAVDQRKGLVEIVSDPDARALNELQILNCAGNLYFRDWDERGAIAALAEATAAARPDKPHEVRYLVKDKTTDWGTRYEIRDLATIELKTDTEVLVHVLGARPTPSRWPGFLKLRRDGQVYSNGTGAGFTRYGCLAGGYVKGQNYRRLQAEAMATVTSVPGLRARRRPGRP